MTYDDLLTIEPYSLGRKEKESLLTERLVELTERHVKTCPEYADMLRLMSYDKGKVNSYKELPFLPVRLFKDLSLKSVPDDEVVKTMTSSGTTGQQVSKIYLDRTTASNQQKTMVKIVSSFTGSERMPMIILDCPSVLKNRNMFSARGAGILGFSIFGKKKIYALNDDMKLDVEGLKAFLEQYNGERILLFGFTFMVWQYFYKELVRLKEEGITFDLSQGILIHGGGWKKLTSEAVSEEVFHKFLEDVCGLKSIHDYYGMVEQTGCIYMECECGHLHASIFSDVITRRPKDFSECAVGEPGIIQVVSAIPESYPGHSLLTEDEGIILGEDDCPCGRKGKYFKITGRIKSAEIRGCSDTFAADRGGSATAKIGTSTVNLNIRFLIGNKSIIDDMPNVRPLRPFSDDIMNFIHDVSAELISVKEGKAFPDIVTLGFWLRKASLTKIRSRYEDRLEKHIGKGVAFHIAPSNVPVNYAYSLFTGLLCGNANIVRVPSKDFPQIGIINQAIANALNNNSDMKKYIALVRYDRDKDINDYLSNLADVRIIWGGDKTIEEIRKSPIKSRTTEVLFADRYSLAVIDSDYYMDMISGDDEAANRKIADRFAIDFYNDTYLSDQNACTSPRVVVWTGKRISEAKNIFWDRLHELVDYKYPFQPIQGVNKLTTMYEAAVGYADDSYVAGNEKERLHGGMKLQESADNLLLRVSVNRLTPELMDYRGNSGLFYEYDTDDISSLFDFCNDTHCQTIGLLGEKDILKPLFEMGLHGVDRVAKVGHTMDFDFEWDGYDLFEELTRLINY